MAENHKKVTTVYLVRHGTTAWNQLKYYQGSTDNPLDEVGEQQGALLARYFENIHIDLGVTSPLCRAAKTLHYCLASQDHEVPILVEPDVAEIDLGKLEGMTAEQMKDVDPDFYYYFVKDGGRGKAVATGGESMLQVYDRISSGIMRIVREHPGETIVVASHGAALQAFLSFAHGIPGPQMQRFTLMNVSVSCIEVDEDGKINVLFVGDKHHIPEDLQFCYSKK